MPLLCALESRFVSLIIIFAVSVLVTHLAGASVNPPQKLVTPPHYIQWGEGGENANDAPIGQVVPINDNSPGTLPGSFNVDRNGNANYTIPLSVPSGVNGMEPNLSVNYMGGGNSLLGFGFHLAGVDAIVRGPRNLLDDGPNTRYTLTWDETDVLYFMGQRLILQSGQYGYNGSTYHPQNNNRIKVVLHGSLVAVDSWFEVFLPDGDILQYGQSDDAKSMHYQGGYQNSDPGEGPYAHHRVYGWHLDKHTDRYGNEISYHYIYEDMPANNPVLRSSHRLRDISYGGNPQEGTSPSRIINFVYEERPDYRLSWFYGGQLESKYRIKTIYSYVNTGELGAEHNLPAAVYPHRYEFVYEQGFQTGFSRLTSMTRCTEIDGNCLPPTTFVWTDAQSHYEDKPYGESFAKMSYPDAHAAMGTMDHLADDAGGLFGILKQFLVQTGNGATQTMVSFGGYGSQYCPFDTGNWQVWRHRDVPDYDPGIGGDNYVWTDSGVDVRYGKVNFDVDYNNNQLINPDKVCGGDNLNLEAWGTESTGKPAQALTMNYGNSGLTDIAISPLHRYAQVAMVDDPYEPNEKTPMSPVASLTFGDNIVILESQGSGQYKEVVFDDGSENYILDFQALDLQGDGLSDLLLCKGNLDMEAWIAEVKELNEGIDVKEAIFALFFGIPTDFKIDKYPAWGMTKRERHTGKWHYVLREPGLPFAKENLINSGVDCSSEDAKVVMDLDGDGIQELLVSSARKGNGSLYGASERPPYQRLVIDLENGDGELVDAGLRFDYLQRARKYRPLGHNKELEDPKLKPYYLASGVGKDLVCDVNGDGLQDVIRWDFMDETGVLDEAANRALASWEYAKRYNAYVDFTNGDIPYGDYEAPYVFNEGIRAWINTGIDGENRFQPGPFMFMINAVEGHDYKYDYLSSWSTATAGDMNNDGRCDLILFDLSVANAAIRNFNVFSFPSVLAKPDQKHSLFGGYSASELKKYGYDHYEFTVGEEAETGFPALTSIEQPPFVSDVNADGLLDIQMYQDARCVEWITEWHWHNGVAIPELIPVITRCFGPDHYNEGVYVDNAGHGYWSMYTRDGGLENLLASITNGLGARIDINYKPQTSHKVYHRNDFMSQLPGYPLTPAFSPNRLVYQVHYDAGLSRANNQYDVISQRYWYDKASQSVNGRGNLGMARRRIEETRLNPDGVTTRLVSINEKYHTGDFYDEELQQYWCVGCLMERIVTVESDEVPEHNPDWVVERTYNHWELSKQVGGVYRAYPRRITNQYYELPGYSCQELELGGQYCSTLELADEEPLLEESNQVLAMDEWGYPTLTESSTPENTTTTRLAYDHDEGQWLLGRVAHRFVTDKVGNHSLTREASYEYDGNGDLYFMTHEPSNEQYRHYMYFGRDAFGNISAKSLTDSNNDNLRYVTTQWSNDGIYPLEEGNSYFKEQALTWFPGYDVVLRATNANGISQAMDYDALGRVVSSQTYLGQIPLSSESYVDYQRVFDVKTQAWQTHVISTVDQMGEGREHYDRLGRLVYSQSTNSAVSTVNKVYQSYQYGKQGELLWESRVEPTNVMSNYKTRYQYDHAGRLTSMTLPDDSITKYQYAGLTKHVIDSNGNRRWSVTDQRGNTIKISNGHKGDGDANEDLAVLCYDYNRPFGQLTRVAPCNPQSGDPQPIIIEPGLYGEQLSLMDPRMSKTENTYNSYLELIEIIDAEDKRVTYEYDKLGRQTKRHYHGQENNPDELETSTWMYDQTHWGALNEAINPNGDKLVYQYDNRSRLSRFTQVTANQSFHFDYTYDDLSRLETLSYPTLDDELFPFRLRFGYDNTSRLVKVTNDHTNDLYWRLQETNALDQVSSMVYGNGAQLSRSYDPIMYHLEGQQSLAPNNTKLQHFSYDWDTENNLLSRTDHIHQQSESFIYDSNNRMVEQVIGKELQNNDMTYKEVSYEYNKWGNLKQKGNQGGYDYHPSTNRLSKTDLMNFYYDDTGNVLMSSTPVQATAYHWTYFNKPKEIISWPEVHSQYTYTAEDDRQEKIDLVSGKTRTYVSGLYEREYNPETNIASHHYFIPSGAGVIGELTRTIEKTLEGWQLHDESLQYLHPDHLGSATLITDGKQNNSEILQRLSYEPFGNQRPVSDWTAGNDNYFDQPLFNFGFTGHEVQEGTKADPFIHMQGRLYNPTVGQFLNADPYVPDPYDTDSYNRYSYVKNNPLSFTDPSGYTETRVVQVPAGQVQVMNQVAMKLIIMSMRLGIQAVLNPQPKTSTTTENLQDVAAAAGKAFVEQWSQGGFWGYVAKAGWEMGPGSIGKEPTQEEIDRNLKTFGIDAKSGKPGLVKYTGKTGRNILAKIQQRRLARKANRNAKALAAEGKGHGRIGRWINSIRERRLAKQFDQLFRQQGGGKRKVDYEVEYRNYGEHESVTIRVTHIDTRGATPNHIREEFKRLGRSLRKMKIRSNDITGHIRMDANAVREMDDFMIGAVRGLHDAGIYSAREYGRFDLTGVIGQIIKKDFWHMEGTYIFD